MGNRFDEKVVIVTGSSSGIGQAVLLAFAAEGASVVIHGTSADRLKATEGLLLDAGVPPERFLSVKGDVREEAVHEEIVAQTLTRFYRIDVLVNNAGISSKLGVDVNSAENFDYVLAINFRAPFLLTQKAVPHLEKTRGCVVNTSTVISYSKPSFNPNWPVYGAAKAALDTWVKYDAQSLAERGIRINNVNPGPFLTNQIVKTLPAGLSEEERSRLLKEKEDVISSHSVFQRFGKMSELTPTYLHLADNEASGYTTGSCVTVDGGMAFFASKRE